MDACRGNERELPSDDCHEDVERPELACGVGHEAVDVGVRCHVAREGKSLDAGCSRLGCCFLCALAIDVDDRNGAARLGQRSGDRATDAATSTADDERGLLVEHPLHVAILEARPLSRRVPSVRPGTRARVWKGRDRAPGFCRCRSRLRAAAWW